MQQISNEYKKRVEEFSAQLKSLEQKTFTISGIRIIVFLAAIVNFYYFLHDSLLLSVGGATIFLTTFIFLVQFHSKLRFKKSFTEQKLRLNESQLRVLEQNFSDFDGGKEFQNPEHPFSYDLDLFGEQSIFQMLNRTSTIQGKNALAESLQNPLLDANAIIKRQESAKELSKMLNFRQNFYAFGSLNIKKKAEKNTELDSWIDEKPQIPNGKFLRIIAILLSVFALSVLVLYSLGIISYGFLMLNIAINLGVVASQFKKIDKLYKKLETQHGNLKKQHRIIELIENQQFKSGKLKTIHQQLFHSGASASSHFKKLQSLLDKVELRYNQLAFFFLNAFFLWDIHISLSLESWKQKNLAYFSHWMEVIAEIDMLNSLADLHFNFPHFAFPSFSGENLIQAENLTHPLLEQNSRISNNITLKNWGDIFIITGSNMSGKSTFLRSLGVNLVLAQIGAPVCASKMDLQLFRLYTSMRTSDSLVNSKSYFFAELQRLQKITKASQQEENVLIILDEVLKGTNSGDKLNGSLALVKRLSGLNVAGFIATHDLKLGELEEKFPEKIQNYSFEVEIIDDELVFDYKIRRGVCKTKNAEFMMRKMDII